MNIPQQRSLLRAEPAAAAAPELIRADGDIFSGGGLSLKGC